MAEEWLHGVDASYTILTEQKARELYAAGVRVWMQCLWTGREQPPPRVTNLRAAAAAGMIPGGYCSVTGSRPGEWHAGQGRAGVPDDLWAQLALVPIDVELAGIANAIIRAAVERMYELGKRRAIYTSYGHWTGHQGDTHQFTDCLLFNAVWDGDPDVDFARLPYGGWRVDQVVGEQWSGGTLVTEGVFVDRDTFNKRLLLGKEDDVTDAQYQQLLANDGALLAQLGRLGADVRNLTTDVQGVFRYAHDHALADDMHMPGVLPADTEELRERIDDLQRRLDAGAAELAEAAKALGGS